MRTALLLLLVLGVPVLAQDNPVTNGSFETVEASGVPVDWELLGRGKVVTGGHSGQRALLLEREPDEKTETGLNRRWKPDSGAQGAMLTQLKGGLEFWYQAAAAGPSTGCFVVGLIAMNDKPLEGTGARREMYEVPVGEIGDGKWHRGLVKYDFSGYETAKWVHVAARIEGGGGRLLLDDLKWVASVGPLPRVKSLALAETPGQEGRACSVTAVVTNAGDAPLQAAAATLGLPAYLQATGPLIQGLPPTPPDALSRVTWQVTGLRDRTDVLTVAVSAGQQAAEARLPLAADLVVEQLQAQRFLLAPGESTTLRLVVTNNGNAAAVDLRASLVDGPATVEAVADRTPRQLPLVPPGGTASVTWTAALPKPFRQVRLQAEVDAGAKRLGAAATELLCAPGRPAGPAPAQRAYARTFAGGAAVGNAALQLVFARDAAGAPGPAWLLVQRGGKWQPVAVLPQLGSVATAPASHGEGSRPLKLTGVKAEGGGAGARLLLTGTVPGCNWPCTWTIAAREGADTLDYALQVTPSADGALYGLRGPMLYVGEGTWGARKTEALLPGLEWLVGDEVSSSTLDIAANMPQRWRWCPPPHAVTIPAMSVHSEGVTVGLLWDQLQQYAPQQTRPRAIFGAPDRFEGRNACLLGLMVPGGADPEWWAPPRLATENPWKVERGQPLTIRARLYARAGAADALSALDRWFALYGAPPPERLPHGKTLADEISLSAHGYLQSLWDPKTQKWFASLNGPQQMTTLGWHAPYLYDLVYAARLASQPEVRQACEERVALVKQLAGTVPTADDLGFEFGNPVGALMGRADQAAGLLRSQGEDGAWRFHARVERSGIFAGMDYGELGKDQAAESGTCGANANLLLQYARMTGDPAATAGGLRTLEFLKGFTVPRAAQVWEVPVHTPDVLASADVCEAYLEGYRLTGDKSYLQRAVFWARTGLPFIYMWDVPDYEALRYASIPVFGASWYTCNWFGQPVQWNGLRLARAYLALAEYDDSYPWRRIAEGITISCLWQQHGRQVAGQMWPDDNDKWLALWPDNFNSVDLRRCPWVFAPRQILDLVYRLQGLHAEPRTATITQDGKAVRLSACAAISRTGWQGDRLSAELRFTPPQTSQVLVCNLARPAGVTVNGQALPAVARLALAPGPGYEYLPAARLLHVKPGPGPRVHLEITGAAFDPGRVAPGLMTAVDFSFDNDEEGWRAACDLSEPLVRDGAVAMAVLGTDPYFVRGSLEVPTGTLGGVLVRLAVPADTRGDLQLFWTTGDSPQFDEAKSLHVPLIADGQFHDYRVATGGHALWQGQLTGLRLDPGSGPAGGEVRLDRLQGLPR